MPKITIPRTIGAAERKLNSLGELATATEWERAAIVAAYVKPRAGQGRRQPLSIPTEVGVSAKAFADLGIHGLTSHGTVLLYVNAWLNILDEDGNIVGQRQRPEPGKSVEIPTEPWPPTRTGTDGYESEQGMASTLEKLTAKHGADKVAGKLAEKAPEAVAQQVANPAVAAKVVDDPEAKKQVGRATVKRTRSISDRRKAAAAAAPDAVAQTAATVDAEQTAMSAIPSNSPAFNTMQRGRAEAWRGWNDGLKNQTFTPFDRQHMVPYLSFLRRMVDEMTAFVETEDDPYAAAAQCRAEHQALRDIALDLAEMELEATEGTDFSDIERFANEGS